MKILKWIGIILLAIPVIIIILLHVFESNFRSGPKMIEKTFEANNIPHKVQTAPYQDGALRWIEVGNPEAPNTVLFFHGAPGSWSDFSDFMNDPDLLEHAFFIALDRPGYGYSNYGQAEGSIMNQVAAAEFIMERYDPDTLMVVGYSYGGPIAGCYTAHNKENLKSLLMLAPVNAPDGERIFWFNHIFKTKLAKLILPTFINVANDEKMAHTEALQVIRGDWAEIEVPVVHMHCTDDWIAPYEVNTNWSKENIPADQLQMITWTGNSHFLPNQVKDRIKPVMLELLTDGTVQ